MATSTVRGGSLRTAVPATPRQPAPMTDRKAGPRSSAGPWALGSRWRRRIVRPRRRTREDREVEATSPVRAEATRHPAPTRLPAPRSPTVHDVAGRQSAARLSPNASVSSSLRVGVWFVVPASSLASPARSADLARRGAHGELAREAASPSLAEPLARSRAGRPAAGTSGLNPGQKRSDRRRARRPIRRWTSAASLSD
jgi:hypothetical protein